MHGARPGHEGQEIAMSHALVTELARLKEQHKYVGVSEVNHDFNRLADLIY